jgi:hypothetical protein
MPTVTTYECAKCSKVIEFEIEQHLQTEHGGARVIGITERYLLSCRHNKIVGNTRYHCSEYQGTYSTPLGYVRLGPRNG